MEIGTESSFLIFAVTLSALDLLLNVISLTAKPVSPGENVAGTAGCMLTKKCCASSAEGVGVVPSSGADVTFAAGVVAASGVPLLPDV